MRLDKITVIIKEVKKKLKEIVITEVKLTKEEVSLLAKFLPKGKGKKYK